MLGLKGSLPPLPPVGIGLLAIVSVLMAGCLPEELDSSPVEPRPIDGIFLLDGRLSFTPCGYPERWFVTTDSVSTPGEYLTQPPSDRLSPFSTASSSETGRSFDRTDSLSQPYSGPDTLSSFRSTRAFSKDSLRAQLPRPDSVNLDTVSMLHARVYGYGTEHADFGPIGRFDRVFVASSVSGVGLGKECPLFAW